MESFGAKEKWTKRGAEEELRERRNRNAWPLWLERVVEKGKRRCHTRAILRTGGKMSTCCWLRRKTGCREAHNWRKKGPSH